MVFVNVVHEDPIVLNCRKNRVSGELFQIVIDSRTGKILRGPERVDADVSTACSKVFGYLHNNKPLPFYMVAG